MSLFLYQLSVPMFERALKGLSGVLKKGEAHAETAKFDSSVLINARLYPDMFPLTKQVQIATDLAARGTARLVGREPPSMPDTEQTFPELQVRIEKARACLVGIEATQMDGAEGRMIQFSAGGSVGGGIWTLSGLDYLTTYVVPNFYFHVTTAYDILRHNGVQLAKGDYIGTIKKASRPPDRSLLTLGQGVG